MKCEKCGNELTGGTIICRACHHNNALRGVGQWRARKTGELPAAPKPQTEITSTATTKQPFTPPRIVPRKDAPTPRPANTATATPAPQQAESNLLHFPAAQAEVNAAPAASQSEPKLETTPKSAAMMGSTPESVPSDEAVTPHWRDQLRERVREVREKRSGSLADTPSHSKLTAGPSTSDQNPIVQAALNRIQRGTYPEPATVAARTARQASLAATALQRAATAPAMPPAPQPAASAETRAIAGHNPHPFAPRSNETAARPLTQRSAVAPSGDLSSSARSDRNAAPAAKPQTTAVTPLLPRPHNQRMESRTLTPRAEADAPRSNATPIPAASTAPRTGDSGRLPSAESFILPLTVRRTTGSLRHSGSLRERAVNTTEIIEIPQTPTAPVDLPAPATRPTTKPLPEVASRSASLWVRTMAGMCDFEAVAVAYLPLFWLYATLKTSLGDTSSLIMVTLLAVIAFVFQLVMLFHAGRTFGMAMLKLRLIDAKDERRTITRQQHCLRAMAATVAFLLPPINLIVARLNPAHHSLPDLLSGTTVTAVQIKADPA